MNIDELRAEATAIYNEMWPLIVRHYQQHDLTEDEESRMIELTQQYNEVSEQLKTNRNNMNKKLEILIMQRQKDGKNKQLHIDATITRSDFDEHDTAGILFALEFAANNHSEIPMRVHINEA